MNNVYNKGILEIRNRLAAQVGIESTEVIEELVSELLDENVAIERIVQGLLEVEVNIFDTDLTTVLSLN
jgi:hypothetical protein